MLAGWEQQPDLWYGEFVEWREALLGPRPRKESGARGYENWNLVSLGMLLAWGYFAAELGEAAETSPAPEEPRQLELPYIKPPMFAVLGPDGKPVVEGYK